MTINEEAKKYFHLGVKCYKNNDFEGAINNFTKAIKIESNYKEAYYARGTVYNSLREYEETIKDYTKAIAIDSDFIDAYNDRGAVYYEIGKYEDAINDYTKVISLKSDCKEAYNNRGASYSALKKYKDAINDYNEALNIDSKYKWPYNNRGIIYSRFGEYEDAINDFESAIKLDSNFNMPYFNMGITYIIFKNIEEKEEGIKKENIKKGKNFFKAFLEIQNKENILNSSSKISFEEPNELASRTITIENDILFLIKSILFDSLMNDKDKLILIELISYCFELMEKIRFKKENFNLTHYTKSGNLKFLLKKKADFGKLRLNNTIYMNDPEEGQIFKRLLSKYKNNGESNIFQYDSDINNYTYLTCFCSYEKRDVLPMWVHYGDGGKGIELVFNEKFFENQELYYVQYIDTQNFDINKIDNNIRKEFKKVFNFLSKTCFAKSENKRFLEYTNIIINCISYLFKDKAYDYENEVRMVQFRDYESEDICINEDLEVPRLYIEYKKEIKAKDYCEEIIVGPKGNFEEVATYGKYVGVKQCTKSKIKYR